MLSSALKLEYRHKIMSTTQGLKEQFCLIQGQQKENYLSRRALGPKIRSKVDDATQRENMPQNLLPEDDLGLRTHSETKPTEHAHSTVNEKQSLDVAFFQKEIERLQLLTTQLNVAVAQKTREVAELRSQMEEEKEALGGVSSKATQRIVELSRRNRELMSELAVEKNRVKQLHKDLQEAVSKISASADKRKEAPPTTAEQNCDKRAIVRLQDELSEAKQRSVEYSNQCQQLKQEVKVAHRALLREVGEGADLQAVLGGTGPSAGWRGRAQQVAALQGKVAELKRQLQSRAAHDSGRSAGPDDELGGGRGWQTAEVACTREERCNKPEERQRATIRKMEEERKKNLDEIRQELQSLQELYSRCQQQNTALKVRNKTLTADSKALKVQVASLVEKSARDCALIQKLMAEAGQRNSGTAKPPLGESEESSETLQVQFSECLATLKKQTTQFVEESCDGEEQAKCSSKRKDLPKVAPAWPNGRTTSLPPIKMPRSTRGVTPVRKSISAGHHHLPWSSNMDTAELQALLCTTQVEKDRLMELTTIFQTRLNASSDHCVQLDTELRACRCRVAELEKQVCRLPAAVKCGKQGGVAEVSSDNAVAAGSLRDQLSLQLDENCVLKETLELTRHEKMEDMKTLYSMLQETKQVFTESINAIRENTKNP